MKRKVWRSGNSWVVTIPSEFVEKFNIMEKSLVDFDIKDVFEETEKMFENFFNSDILSQIGNRSLKKHFRQPLADLRETNDNFIVSIEIPGVSKKDIQLNVTDNSISVKVEDNSESEIKDETKGFLKSERIYNSFYRSINLPSRIIPESSKANYNNGILEIVLPKYKGTKLAEKKIQIE
ncbi:Hsp20/alpha crystallin family protein [Candidatus Woesearchaeota archaeon]|nr:Hsp20/alpha crystallin family protein [Candidatus Woesearchaeota archaeon]